MVERSPKGTVAGRYDEVAATHDYPRLFRPFFTMSLRLSKTSGPLLLRLISQRSCWRLFSRTALGTVDNALDDEHVLDISGFGDYSLVLPVDVEGTNLQVESFVPPSIRRPLYAQTSPAGAVLRPETDTSRSLLRRTMTPAALERKIVLMTPARKIAASALLRAGNMIKARIKVVYSEHL